ncbi:tetratricopeptide repeat protein [Oceanobacillus saliphilus]|uniref:tetratricopeptide repeat protein n=1 Tax=Oceanobacillus saliphilus TaxID=2925834 RepID=UPI00201D500C|nr:tetratricopeptide repeat protein [Oceanobacillus saliphilus]
MVWHQLQRELSQQGYQKAAELLDTFNQHDNKLTLIQLIFKNCNLAVINFPDDIRILYTQLNALSSYDKQYEKMVVRDFETILLEIVKPNSNSAMIFMEANELQEVIALYEKAMQADSGAQLALGKYYKALGRDEWAFAWYEAAANAGNLDAIYWLGNYYFDGIIVAKNFEKAFHYYKEAALKGHADAMNNYADMYFLGEYVEKNDKRAFELFTIAADRGVAESMYTLGYLYENGIGTELNAEKAKHWFTQSALNGDDFAANRLGNEAVENGQGEEALRWYKLAADRQDTYGEYNLGMCYESGIGTSINRKKAKYWYQKAALKGDEEAKAKLKEF